MKTHLTFFISMAIVFCAPLVKAQQTDTQLAEKLKQELQFDIQRKKGFQNFKDKNNVFEREREKGLSMFLEEQEKFDIAREKGKDAYKASKQKRTMDESSPEYYADLREKDKQQIAREKSREIHVQTRDRIVSQYSHEGSILSEEQEFNLNQNRPRYDLRKRGSNKWSGSGKSGGSSSSSSGGFGSALDVPPPPPQDYIPQPIDNFEEIPPPPPIPYDESMHVPSFDSGFGEAPLPPPPPPPPEGGWDF